MATRGRFALLAVVVGWSLVVYAWGVDRGITEGDLMEPDYPFWVTTGYIVWGMVWLVGLLMILFVVSLIWTASRSDRSN